MMSEYIHHITAFWQLQVSGVGWVRDSITVHYESRDLPRLSNHIDEIAIAYGLIIIIMRLMN